MSGILKSKTLWFSTLLAVFGAIEVNSQVIPEEFRGYTLIAIAAISAVLRFMTTQPVSEK